MELKAEEEDEILLFWHLFADSVIRERKQMYSMSFTLREIMVCEF